MDAQGSGVVDQRAFGELVGIGVLHRALERRGRGHQALDDVAVRIQRAAMRGPQEHTVAADALQAFDGERLRQAGAVGGVAQIDALISELLHEPVHVAEVAHRGLAIRIVEAGAAPGIGGPVRRVAEPGVEAAELPRRHAGLEALEARSEGGGPLGERLRLGAGRHAHRPVGSVAHACRIEADVRRDDQRPAVGEHRVHVAGAAVAHRLERRLLLQPRNHLRRRCATGRGVVEAAELALQRGQGRPSLGDADRCAGNAFARARKGGRRFAAVTATTASATTTATASALSGRFAAAAAGPQPRGA